MRNMFFEIYNYANCFGGQERFVETLVEGLTKEGIKAMVVGGPNRLSALNHSMGSATANTLPGELAGIKIALYNGNRALYREAWKPKRFDLRIYVQHSHVNDGQSFWWKRTIRQLLLKILLCRVDVAVRVCNSALPDSFAERKILTIYNGVSLPAVPERKFDRASPLRLLMVGAVNDNKNQRIAIESLAYHTGTILVIAGDGPNVEELKILADRLGVSSRIEWLGFVDDLSSVYASSDLLLMLSRFEAFPFAVIEAMANRVPVVAVPVGGVPEVVDASNGWILKQPTAKALAEQLDVIKELNGAELSNKSMLSRQSVEQRFSAEKMVACYLNIVHSRLEN